jgi:hypothetical protein
MTTFCQDKLEDWQSASSWNEGKIIDNDGKERSGLVRYNDMEGVLQFRSGDEEKSFTARNVLSFSFNDSSQHKKRVFYSLEYEDPVNNAKRPLFFELLREYKSFSVLSKKDPVRFNQQDGSSLSSDNSMKNSNGVIRAQQVETIYFMNTRGVIEPYLEMEIQQTNGIFRERVKNTRKVVDDDLPKKYFGEKNYLKIKSFAKENDLKMKRRNDFLKILDYYKTISGN